MNKLYRIAYLVVIFVVLMNAYYFINMQNLEEQKPAKIIAPKQMPLKSWEQNGKSYYSQAINQQQINELKNYLRSNRNEVVESIEIEQGKAKVMIK